MATKKETLEEIERLENEELQTLDEDVQTTFNNDDLNELVEDGEVENVYSENE